MNLLRFSCPNCRMGHITLRVQTDMLTDKSKLSYECYKCGLTLEEYINGNKNESYK